MDIYFADTSHKKPTLDSIVSLPRCIFELGSSYRDKNFPLEMSRSHTQEFPWVRLNSSCCVRCDVDILPHHDFEPTVNLSVESRTLIPKI